MRRGIISSAKGGDITGNLATFNGSTSTLTVADDIAFTCDTFSLSMVINSNDVSVQQSLFRNRAPGGGGTVAGIATEINSSSLSVNNVSDDGAGNFVSLSSSIPLSSSTQYNIVYTFDGVDMNIYLNSTKEVITLIKTGTVGTIDSPNALEIGSLLGGRFFDGGLGFVKFWKNRVLNQTEVTTLYNSGVPKSFATLEASLKTSLTYAPEVANYGVSSVGNELVDKSASSLTTTPTDILYTTPITVNI